MQSTSPVSTRRIFAIAGPAMLANLTTPLLGVVATTAIGHLGEAHLLGGVAIASVVFDCMFWLFGFLRMGTVALTAQAVGARDGIEIQALLIRAVGIAVLIGALLLILQQPLSRMIFGLIGGGDAVTRAGIAYFAIRLWSAPFVLANYVMLGWLVGQARTGLALVLQLLINSVNMAATAWLVLGIGIGLTGAATAAVVAECAGVAAGAITAWHVLGGRINVTLATVVERSRFGRMLAVNRDIMIRTAALIAVFLFFAAQGARAGDQTLAANAVLNNFMLIGSFFLDGLANAAEQLCGSRIGANDMTGFRKSVRLVVAWGFVFGAAVTLLFLVAGDALIDFITTSPEVRLTARAYMAFAALTPLCGVLAYCFDGIYIGATWSRDMRNLMIVALAVYLGCWWLLRSFGNTGLWAALLVFLLARGLLQAWRYSALLRRAFTGQATHHVSSLL